MKTCSERCQRESAKGSSKLLEEARDANKEMAKEIYSNEVKKGQDEEMPSMDVEKNNVDSNDKNKKVVQVLKLIY
jgi:hypothetical protein